MDAGKLALHPDSAAVPGDLEWCHISLINLDPLSGLSIQRMTEPIMQPVIASLASPLP